MKKSNKDNNKLQNIFIVVLVLIAIALIAFIVIDKTEVLNYFKANKVVDQKKEPEDKDSEKKEPKEETEVEYELAPNVGNTVYYIYKKNNEAFRNIAITNNYEEIEDKNSVINTYKCDNCNLSLGIPFHSPAPSEFKIGPEGVFASVANGDEPTYIINSVTGKVYKSNYTVLYSYNLKNSSDYVYMISLIGGDNSNGHYRLLKGNNRYLNDELYDFLPATKTRNIESLYNDTTNNIVVGKDNKKGILNLKENKYILKVGYDKAYFSPNGNITTYSDNKSVIYDKNGKKLLTTDNEFAFCYDEFIVVTDRTYIAKDLRESSIYKIKLIDYKNNVLTNEVTYKDEKNLMPTDGMAYSYITKGNKNYTGEYGIIGPFESLVFTPDLANKTLIVEVKPAM